MAKTDPLAGITEKSPKAEMWDRLKKLGAGQKREEGKQKKRVDEIVARLTKLRVGPDPEELRHATISWTDEEWQEVLDFIEEWKDLAPVGLRRLLFGGRVMFDEIEDDEPVAV